MSNKIKINIPPGRIRASYKVPVSGNGTQGQDDGFKPLFPEYYNDDTEFRGDVENRHNGSNGQGDPERTGSTNTVRRNNGNSEPASSVVRYEEAFREGYEKGRKEAQDELQKKYESDIHEIHVTMTNFVRTMYTQFDEFRNRAEQFVVRFSIDVASKVVKREIDAHQDIVLAQIKDALHKVIGVEKIKVLVNPHDEELVRAQRSPLLATADSVREMVIEADEKIERGGCVIESNHGNVDARASTQLKNIEIALEEKTRYNKVPAAKKRKSASLRNQI